MKIHVSVYFHGSLVNCIDWPSFLSGFRYAQHVIRQGYDAILSCTANLYSGERT
jgi:hypothetical protein